MYFLHFFLKKKSKAIKAGIKAGKGIAAESTPVSNAQVGIETGLMGQSFGMIGLPFLAVISNKLIDKIAKNKKKFINFSAPVGLSWGGYFGSMFSKTFLTDLPSAFDIALGIIAGLIFSTCGAIIMSHFYKKRYDPTNSTTETVIESDSDAKNDEEKILKNIFNRLIVGLRVGAFSGLSFGASFEFIHPGIGVMTAAICAAVAAPIGGLLFSFYPKFAKKYFNSSYADKKKEAANLSDLKSSLIVGSLFGSTIGAVIGTFFFPGIGSILGGLLGSGIGAITYVFAAKLVNLDMQSQLSLGTRAGIVYGAAFGAIIGSFIFPGIGTVIGITVGSLLGCLLGFTIPLIVLEPKMKECPEPDELLKENLPDTETKKSPSLFKQSKFAVSLGSTIGGMIGAAIGTFIPVVGTLLGLTLGAALGASAALTVVFATVLIADLTKTMQKEISTNESEEPSDSFISTHQQLNKEFNKCAEKDIQLDSVSVPIPIKASFNIPSVKETFVNDYEMADIDKSGMLTM